MREGLVSPTLTNKDMALQIAELYSFVASQAADIDSLNQALVTPPLIPPPSTVQAVNQMLNGTFSHSQNSWINSGAANDGRYECYAFFSQTFVDGQAMYKNSTVTGGSPNYTLKEATHAGYDVGLSDWDWSTGAARFAPEATIDALLPGNNIEPGYTFYASFDIVRLNQYVTCSPDARMFCGIYGESTALAGWSWLYGEFLPTAEVFGTVATPTSRDYVIYARTNRGFTVLSDAVTVASAPSDTDFSNGARVVLTWKAVLKYGVEGYDIYRDTGGTFLKLFSVPNGQLTYIDNNSFESIETGYPTADYDSLVAYTASVSNIISQIPYQGDPLNPVWITIPFALRVPQTFDMGDAVLTSGQWLRWGWTGVSNAFDLRMTDGITVEASDILQTAESGQFRADQVGLDILVLNGDVATLSTIVTYTSANEVKIADTLPSDSDSAIIYIYEGAPDHAIYVDLAHLDYVEGAAFAPNAADISTDRGIPPVAPNGTTQGGSGTGGGGIDGQPVCLFEEEWVQTKSERITARELHERFSRGERFLLPDGYGKFNHLTETKLGLSDIWYLETANGANVMATDTKQIYIRKDELRTVGQLKTGDEILTEDVSGAITPDTILAKYLVFRQRIVVQIGLSPNHSFIGGTRILMSNAKPLDTTVLI